MSRVLVLALIAAACGDQTPEQPAPQKVHECDPADPPQCVDDHTTLYCASTAAGEQLKSGDCALDGLGCRAGGCVCPTATTGQLFVNPVVERRDFVAGDAPCRGDGPCRLSPTGVAAPPICMYPSLSDALDAVAAAQRGTADIVVSRVDRFGRDSGATARFAAERFPLDLGGPNGVVRIHAAGDDGFYATTPYTVELHTSAPVYVRLGPGDSIRGLRLENRAASGGDAIVCAGERGFTDVRLEDVVVLGRSPSGARLRRGLVLGGGCSGDFASLTLDGTGADDDGAAALDVGGDVGLVSVQRLEITDPWIGLHVAASGEMFSPLTVRGARIAGARRDGAVLDGGVAGDFFDQGVLIVDAARHGAVVRTGEALYGLEVRGAGETGIRIEQPTNLREFAVEGGRIGVHVTATAAGSELATGSAAVAREAAFRFDGDATGEYLESAGGEVGAAIPAGVTVSLDRSTFAGATAVGVQVAGVLKVDSVTVTGGKGDGMAVAGAAARVERLSTFGSAELTANRGPGLRVSGGATWDAAAWVRNNGRGPTAASGVIVDGDATTLAGFVSAEGSGRHGVEAASGIIRGGHQAIGNAGNGFDLSGRARLTGGATASDNGGHGVHARDDVVLDAAVADDLVARGNLGHGVLLEQRGDARLGEVGAFENHRTGVVFHGPPTVELVGDEGSVASNNDGGGLLVASGTARFAHPLALRQNGPTGDILGKPAVAYGAAVLPGATLIIAGSDRPLAGRVDLHEHGVGLLIFGNLLADGLSFAYNAAGVVVATRDAPRVIDEDGVARTVVLRDASFEQNGEDASAAAPLDAAALVIYGTRASADGGEPRMVVRRPSYRFNGRDWQLGASSSGPCDVVAALGGACGVVDVRELP